MIRECLFVGMVGVALSTMSSTSSAMQQGNNTAQPMAAASVAQQRETIRQMPLLERPNRPGHFYGNTVRRIHDRRMRRGG